MNDNAQANGVRLIPVIGVVRDDAVTITNPTAWAKARRRPRPALRLVPKA